MDFAAVYLCPELKAMVGLFHTQKYFHNHNFFTDTDSALTADPVINRNESCNIRPHYTNGGN